jgi:hypothetical protein
MISQIGCAVSSKPVATQTLHRARILEFPKPVPYSRIRELLRDRRHESRSPRPASIPRSIDGVHDGQGADICLVVMMSDATNVP